MASGNHQLDERIRKAAMSEFAEKGFEESSIRNIAYLADLTVGAVYNRYKDKDELFRTCLSPLLSDMRSARADIESNYAKTLHFGKLDRGSLIDAIRYEMDVTVSTFFDHYDESYLMLCCSEGSSVRAMMANMMKEKSSNTSKFLEAAGIEDMDMRLMSNLMAIQTHSIVTVIGSRLDEKTAREYLSVMEAYNSAGWKAVSDKVFRNGGSR